LPKAPRVFLKYNKESFVAAIQPLITTLRQIPPLRAAARQLRGTYERYRINAWQLEGEELHSGAPLRLLFAGHLETKNVIASLAFRRHQQVSQRKLWLWDAFRMGKEPGNALTFIESSVPLARNLTEPDWFSIPCGIEGILDLDVAERRLSESKSFQQDLRKITRNGFSYMITRTPAAFADFYRDMYLPHVNDAFTGQESVLPYDTLKGAMDNCELLLVTQNGKPVAGNVLLYLDGTARSWIMGVKNGNREHVRAGAAFALDYYRLKRLRTLDFREVHMGASRPFLNDDALRLKRRWGMGIIGHVPKWMALKVHTTPAVRSFLEQNPFVHEHDGNLRAAVFLDSARASEEEYAKRWSELYLPGIERFDLFRMEPDGTLVMDWKTDGA
jgi:hypothetical protein